ncbi:unnamed protein product, partial [Prunus brigantina]
KNRKHQQSRRFIICPTHLQQSKIPNLQIGERTCGKTLQKLMIHTHVLCFKVCQQ